MSEQHSSPTTQPTNPDSGDNGKPTTVSAAASSPAAALGSGETNDTQPEQLATTLTMTTPPIITQWAEQGLSRTTSSSGGGGSGSVPQSSVASLQPYPASSRPPASAATTTTTDESPPAYWSASPHPTTRTPTSKTETSTDSSRGKDESSSRPEATSPSQILDSHRQDVQHMGCTCKKTRCLKLYCQCFAFGLYCSSNCRCLMCYNVASQEKARLECMRLILTRNPTAFDVKYQKGELPGMPTLPAEMASPETETAPGTLTTPTNADAAKMIAHKLGCKCRRSNCVKKYCECYAGNVKCTANCRCVACKNMAPGQQSGAGPSGALALQLQAETPVVKSEDNTNNNNNTTPSLPSPPNIIGVPQVSAVPLAVVPQQQQQAFPHLHPGQVMQNAQAARRNNNNNSTSYNYPNMAVSPQQIMGQGSTQQHSTQEGGVSALMLAAYAMAEYGQGSAPRPTRKRPKPEPETQGQDNENTAKSLV